MSEKKARYDICLISIHGLIRATNLELGRDADTGGQTKYVVELARALADCDQVEKVYLVTRKIVDENVDKDYAKEIEEVVPGLDIVRIEAGPEAYLPKEQLWDHLDTFVDNLLEFLRKQPRLPHLIHSHYADAGYVGSRISQILATPLVHTGHSLGRVKRQRLLASGLSNGDIETRYNMARRVEAEEQTLATAEKVITSTSQEIREQYELYDYYQPDQMSVIPPGTDLSMFHPPKGKEWQSPIAAQIGHFLKEPEKPIILALSRPDKRKNIAALVHAYGRDGALQDIANLVIVAGIRDDIRDLDDGAQEVLGEILFLIDRYNLYGKIAFPKQHNPSDVPLIYRLAAFSGGVFVNPALTEPFGLTLIEAAASGLPIVATEDGGPTDIIENCKNGVLVNPLEVEDIAAGLRKVLFDWESWQVRSTNGLKGVRNYYSWKAHTQQYLTNVIPLIGKEVKKTKAKPPSRRPLLYNDRIIVTDLDQNLLANRKALPEFIQVIRSNRKKTSFGIATGRRLDSALKVMKKHGIPEPDVLISSGGTEIHYSPKLTEDKAWKRHIEKQWTPKIIKRVLSDVPGLKLQPKSEQSPFKISYYVDQESAPSMEEIRQKLFQEEQSVSIIFSFGQYLDIMPNRASKGLALRYISNLWNVPLDHMLVAGGSGADEDMMRGNTLAVVVGNRHHEELSQLEEIERIYFANEPGAAGILEAIKYYDFLDSCRDPEEDA